MVKFISIFMCFNENRWATLFSLKYALEKIFFNSQLSRFLHTVMVIEKIKVEQYSESNTSAYTAVYNLE